jgi:hypothetical protein
MTPAIYPIKKLPPGLSGRLEVTDVLPRRDWRDTAATIAALFGVAYFVLPHVFSFHLLDSAVGAGLALYLLRAGRDFRIFTPMDQCSVRAVIEPVNESEASAELSQLVDQQDRNTANKQVNAP